LTCPDISKDSFETLNSNHMITPVQATNTGRKPGLFRTADGKNYAFVFILICSLFLLWGFAHALLDVLNKHFQNSLEVTKAQSGCVQAAVYGGYFLMALPAGMIARRFGYKTGIIVGLTLFALGAFWFVPATKSDQWTGTATWVGQRFDLTVVTSMEAKAKLLEARSDIATAKAKVAGLETKTPADALKATTEATDYLTKAGAALTLAAPNVTAVEKLTEVRAAVGELAKTIGTKDFEKGCAAASVAIVGLDKASQMTAFGAFLLGLLVIALGLTCLETIANPYTTVLGPPETGASRINLAQTNNAVGWILGPFIGGMLIFSAGETVNLSNEGLATPYIGLGVVVTLILIMFAFSKIPDIHAEEHAAADVKHKDKTTGERSIWSQPHFVFAVVAQFLYVAAQTGVNSFFINYVVEVNKWTEQKSALVLSLGGMVLFAVGRFSGSFLMTRVKPHLALASYALANVVLLGLVVAGLGFVSALGLIASYFFMSIMFPTIFALGIRGLGENTKKGAAIIVMSIVGGAIAPILMGALADKHGMQFGFIIPLLCFLAIMIYGLVWKKLFARDMGNASESPALPTH
jgi:FHS family L-fucose permease-like MFS transporter